MGLGDAQLAEKIMLKRKEFVEKELGRKCYSPKRQTGAYAGSDSSLPNSEETRRAAAQDALDAVPQ